MSLVAVTNRGDVKAAYSALVSTLQRGATPCDCIVGYPGGNTRATVYWQAEIGMWMHLEDSVERGHIWCCFETKQSVKGSNLSITCEINPPFEGVDLNIGGMFGRDSDHAIYLLHSGRIGGGRKGNGMTRFLAFLHGQRSEHVDLTDGRSVVRQVVGRVGGEHLPAQIAHYVRQVEKFKAQNASKNVTPVETNISDYRPEFSGQKKPYQPRGTVEPQCDHGAIVGALERKLRTMGMRGCNSQCRDMFIGSSDRMKVLFEVKTDTTTTCLYEGVGQLMLHGAAQLYPPVRILVLPDEPEQRTGIALQRLGVRWIVYEWVNGTVVFTGFEQAMDSVEL